MPLVTEVRDQIPHSGVAANPRVHDRLGRSLHDLRLSLTDHCNLRCRYCLPAEVFGPDFRFTHRESHLDVNEIEFLVASFVALGVRKLRLTGGEPLLREDVVEIVRRVSRLDGLADIALTTNGLRLPRFAEDLAKAGLRRINLSCDAFSDEVLSQMAGRKLSFRQIKEGVSAAQSAGLGVKMNMVVQRGYNDHQILPLAKWCRDSGINLRFIEYMDVGTKNRWQRADVVTGAEILQKLKPLGGLIPVDPAYRGEVAQRYRYLDSASEIGLITSISQPFCSDCGRARITATGELITCLFASSGIDLSRFLRPQLDSTNLQATLTQVWSQRIDRYSELRNMTNTPHKHEMWRIGG